MITGLFLWKVGKSKKKVEEGIVMDRNSSFISYLYWDERLWLGARPLLLQ